MLKFYITHAILGIKFHRSDRTITIPTRHVRKGVSVVTLIITVPEDPDEKMTAHVDNSKRTLTDTELDVRTTVIKFSK